MAVNALHDFAADAVTPVNQRVSGRLPKNLSEQ
jgi:hypothetical protein